MKMPPHTTQLRKDTDSILQVTRAIRWIGIVTVALTYGFGGENTLAVLVLVILGGIYNTIQHTSWFPKVEKKISALSVLAIDYLFLCALVMLTGGISSPYYFYLGLPLVIVAYWYKRSSVIGLTILSLTTALVATFYSLYFPAKVAIWQQAAGYIATLSMLALAVNRLTISERVQRRIAIKAREAADTERTRLLSLINSMADAVIATDKDGVISDYNSAALDLLNTNVPLKNRRIQELFDFRLATGKHLNILHATLKQKGIMQRDDLQFINNSGETVKLYVSISRIVSFERGNDEGLIFLLRDITKEKSLDEQRDEFISVASHELRTPLAIAEANISTALLPQMSGKVDPAMKPLLEHAHENIVFLAKLVQDITTLAEAEKDILAIQVAVVDTGQLAQRLIEDYQPQAKEKGLTLQIKVERGLPPIVTSEQHIREILQNFIGNAIKYTKQGDITLGVSRASENPDNILFSVTDTGIGISTSDQKHLFTKFYRSEDYRTRETGGTGLGLYITQKLAQRLNARIWFESKLNKGSIFYLQVPPFSSLKRDQQQIITAQVDNVLNNI